MQTRRSCRDIKGSYAYYYGRTFSFRFHYELVCLIFGYVLSSGEESSILLKEAYLTSVVIRVIDSLVEECLGELTLVAPDTPRPVKQNVQLVVVCRRKTRDYMRK